MGRSERAAEGLVQEGFFEFVEGGDFLRVDFLQAISMSKQAVEFGNDVRLSRSGRECDGKLA